jgi:hypothetical protein
MTRNTAEWAYDYFMHAWYVDLIESICIGISYQTTSDVKKIKSYNLSCHSRLCPMQATKTFSRDRILAYVGLLL